jgi:putative transposase
MSACPDRLPILRWPIREWVVTCWQTRPHESLSHTCGDGRDLSPNEMYAACVGISDYVPLPLTGNDYIELLPTVFRTVNDYGLTSTTELTSASSTAPPPNPAPSTLAPS